MSEMFSGVKVITNLDRGIIDEIYSAGKIEIFDKRYNLNNQQNMYLVLKDEVVDDEGNVTTPTTSSILVRVQGDHLVRLAVNNDTVVSGIRAKNKEQLMAIDALMDDTVNVVSLTGPAGTGKTLLTLAAALHKVEQRVYDKIILTRPMTQVGKHDLGILPGEVDDKFGPYLKNYMCNFEHLFKGRKTVDDMIKFYNMEFMPLQLIRGASWPNAVIIADEVQTLNHHEMLTLGTRIGENSKLIIMGDLSQRDEKIAKDKTGLYHWVNNPAVKASRLTASINLIKSERSEICRLFANVFEEV